MYTTYDLYTWVIVFVCICPEKNTLLNIDDIGLQVPFLIFILMSWYLKFLKRQNTTVFIIFNAFQMDF